MRTLLVLALACSNSYTPPPPPAPLTDAQKQSVRDAIAAAKKRVHDLESARDAAFANASKLQPTDTRCPVTRAQLGLDADTQNGLTVATLGITRVVPPGGTVAGGKASSDLDIDVYSIEKTLKDGLDYQTADQFIADTKRKLDSHKPALFELALMLDAFADPKRVDDKNFVGGGTRGRLYLYSEAAGRVVCAAPVGADSASEVSTTVSSIGATPSKEEVAAQVQAHLTGELIVRTVSEGFDRMVAVKD